MDVHFRASDNLNSTPVSAANPLPVNATVSAAATPPYAATQTGYQQIVGMAASTALTVPATSTYCVVQCETQAVRWRDDGTAPTATVGMPLATGVQIVFGGAAEIAAVRFIQQTATATLNISYYK